MKCQKCGKNEVNFHYSSNVNGCITETHLCQNCATESGYDIGKIFGLGEAYSSNRGQLSDLILFLQGEVSGFMPIFNPGLPINRISQYSRNPQTGSIERKNVQTAPCDCGCDTSKRNEINVDVDEEMKMRRQLNAQMREAVEKEEFEKAAEIRDKIKELEARKSKCDSETTSQDSPAVQ